MFKRCNNHKSQNDITLHSAMSSKDDTSPVFQISVLFGIRVNNNTQVTKQMRIECPQQQNMLNEARLELFIETSFGRTSDIRWDEFVSLLHRQNRLAARNYFYCRNLPIKYLSWGGCSQVMVVMHVLIIVISLSAGWLLSSLSFVMNFRNWSEASTVLSPTLTILVEWDPV